MVSRKDWCFVFLIEFCVDRATVLVVSIFVVSCFTKLKVMWDRKRSFCATSAFAVGMIEVCNGVLEGRSRGGM